MVHGRGLLAGKGSVDKPILASEALFAYIVFTLRLVEELSAIRVSDRSTQRVSAYSRSRCDRCARHCFGQPVAWRRSETRLRAVPDKEATEFVWAAKMS